MSLTDAKPDAPLGTMGAPTPREPRSWRQFARRAALAAIVAAPALYLLVGIGIVYFENWLAFPGGLTPSWMFDDVLAETRRKTGRAIEEVQFSAPDGPTLTGWFMSGDAGSPVVLILHGAGGNIADASQFLVEAADIGLGRVLFFDYRGYGRSEGHATEEGLLADARAAREWLADRCDVAPADVILWGQSLGGALAIDLAQTGARALYTEYTFTTLPEAAANTYFLYPVHWMMRSRLNSLEKIGRVECPTFIVHGDADPLVPYEQSERLFAAAGSRRKTHRRVSGLGHFTPFRDDLCRVRREFFYEFAGVVPAPATSTRREE